MRCLIFDLDGTLVDSELLCNQALLTLLPEIGESPETLMHRYRGKKLATILKDIENRLERQLPKQFERLYRAEVVELFDQHLEPTKGATSALSSLRNPKCVASSGPREKIIHSLRITNLAAYFGDHIFSSYEVGSWKPAPDLFLHAASKMGVRPSQCIVIEDSEVGLEAADAAGMKSIFYNPGGDSKAVNSIASMYELNERIESI